MYRGSVLTKLKSYVLKQAFGSAVEIVRGKPWMKSALAQMGGGVSWGGTSLLTG